MKQEEIDFDNNNEKNVEENGKSKKGIIIVRRHCVVKSGDENKQTNKQTKRTFIAK